MSTPLLEHLVPKHLERLSMVHPDVPAHRDSRQVSLTFREWWQKSSAIAPAIVAEFREQSIVPLVIGNGQFTDLAIAFIAVQIAGKVPAPLRPSIGAGELDEIIARLRARRVIVSDPQDIGAPISVVDLGALYRHPVKVGTKQPPHEHAQIIFTSGTGERLKPVAASHANLLFGARGVDRFPMQHETSPGGRRTFMNPGLTVGTNASQSLLVLPLLRPNNSVVSLEGYSADAFVSTIMKDQISHALLTPAMGLDLLESGLIDPQRLTSLRQVRFIGANVPPSLLKRFQERLPAVELLNLYTTSEAWPARVYGAFGEGPEDAIGKYGHDVSIKTRGGSEAGVGEIGYVALRRIPGRDYFPSDELDSLSGLEDPEWVQTGDLGSIDADGFLYILDRKDDALNMGGILISTLRIENVLHEHSAVKDAAAFGMEHPFLGQFPAAVVVLEAGTRLQEIRRYALEKLGPEGAPRVIRAVPQIPRTDSGKIAKTQLAELASPSGQTSRTSIRPIHLEDEKVVSEIWKKALQVDEIHRDDDFFLLGGDSLRATEISAEILRVFGAPIDFNDFFAANTVALQTDLIHERNELADDATCGVP